MSYRHCATFDRAAWLQARDRSAWVERVAEVRARVAELEHVDDRRDVVPIDLDAL